MFVGVKQFTFKHKMHVETLTQNVLGLVIGFIILKCFGMSFNQSVLMQLTFFVASYVRGYCVRKMFSRLYK